MVILAFRCPEFLPVLTPLRLYDFIFFVAVVLAERLPFPPRECPQSLVLSERLSDHPHPAVADPSEYLHITVGLPALWESCANPSPSGELSFWWSECVCASASSRSGLEACRSALDSGRSRSTVPSFAVHFRHLLASARYWFLHPAHTIHRCMAGCSQEKLLFLITTSPPHKQGYRGHKANKQQD